MSPTLERKQVRRLSPYLYILGIISLVVALGWFVVNRRLDMIVWIAGMIAVFSVLAAVLTDPTRLRAKISQRQARYSSNLLILSLGLLGILVVLNLFVYQNPQRLDLTEDQVYSLAPETLQTLAQLEQPILIRGFFTPDANSFRDGLRPLLDEYRKSGNGMLTYEFVNPLENPVLAERYDVTRDRSVVVIAAEESEVLQSSGERQITSAIVRLSNPGDRQIAYVVGHGERDVEDASPNGYSQLRRTLEAKNYVSQTLNLLANPEIGEEILAIVVAGPTVSYAQEEIDSLALYFAQGGSAVLILDPSLSTEIDVREDLLQEYLQSKWGIILRDDIVVDLSSALPFAGIGVEYGQHPITENVNTLAAYFPTTRTLELVDEEGDAIVLTALVLTGDNSWGEANLDSLAAKDGEIEYTEGQDALGPLVLAVAAENLETGARLVLFGDSDFAANSDFPQLGNGDLLVNSIDWAAGQEDLISLTPKDSTPRFIAPPSVQTVGLIFLISLIIIPGIVIVLGLSIWWRRRSGY